MSHTGNRTNKNITARMIDDIINNPRPKTIPYNPISEENIIEKGGKLDGHQIIGEFRGNGDTVLIGVSSSKILDVNNIINDDEKGVIIGYTPSDTYFQLYRNDGAGSMVSGILDFGKFKDSERHEFEITITTNKLFIRFDGAEDTITTKIPTINDTLYIVSYGIY